MNKQTMAQEELERFIDAHGLAAVLAMLSNVAVQKSEHIAHNWQDYGLAQQWATAASVLELAAIAACRS